MLKTYPNLIKQNLTRNTWSERAFNIEIMGHSNNNEIYLTKPKLTYTILTSPDLTKSIPNLHNSFFDECLWTFYYYANLT
jgi:hypothetical protein